MVSSRIQCRPYFSVPTKLSSVQIEAWQVDELIPWLSWSTARGEKRIDGRLGALFVYGIALGRRGEEQIDERRVSMAAPYAA
jgi:hypothetical protein